MWHTGFNVRRFSRGPCSTSISSLSVDMSGPPQSPTDDAGVFRSPNATPRHRHPLHHSTSRSSARSADNRANQGSSYFPNLSPTATRRAPNRSISTARSLGGRSDLFHRPDGEDGLDEEDDEDESGDTDDVNARNSAPRPYPSFSNDQPVESNHESTQRQYTEDDPLTVKDRQSLMNVDHPFGLPIWKPALYKKSRTVNRIAETAVHASPLVQESHLNIGNLLWLLAFGWWLAAVCYTVTAALWIIPGGGRRYAALTFGLGWYVVWPFGKYVEGCSDQLDERES